MELSEIWKYIALRINILLCLLKIHHSRKLLLEHIRRIKETVQWFVVKWPNELLRKFLLLLHTFELVNALWSFIQIRDIQVGQLLVCEFRSSLL